MTAQYFCAGQPCYALAQSVPVTMMLIHMTSTNLKFDHSTQALFTNIGERLQGLRVSLAGRPLM